jgi:hypothetical protein
VRLFTFDKNLPNGSRLSRAIENITRDADAWIASVAEKIATATVISSVLPNQVSSWLVITHAMPSVDNIGSSSVMTGLLADTTGVLDRDDELRLGTVDAARQHPQARHAMLQDATSVRASIPSRPRVFATHDDAVDLKVAAFDPIVKIALGRVVGGFDGDLDAGPAQRRGHRERA